MTVQTHTRRAGFHVMAKPGGARCNLDCRYCFYLEKEKLYEASAAGPGQEGGGRPPAVAMPPEVLESYVRQYIEAQDAPVVQFAWQGGEPTLLGVPFFERAVALQKQYANGKRIENAFQTNGVLLDTRWAEFLRENRFLVGISLDGPADIHDRYRVDRGGHPTHARVMRGLNLLREYGVEFNTLTCVHRGNAKSGREVYRFLKEIGSDFHQFIPIVERIAETPGEDGLVLPHPGYEGKTRIAPWAVPPEDYGQFLIDVFDEWVKRDVGHVFVQAFEVALEAWLGLDPSLCVHSRTCGRAMALEHTGDVYACDHFVYPDYRLGNLLETPLAELVDSPAQTAFGEAKADALPRMCVECSVRFACNGGCPKHRFATTPDGEPGLNYLCAGYRRFFSHVDPYMRHMAAELSRGRSPASVMALARRTDGGRRPIAPGAAAAPGPNDPCPCGSGRKFKKCCGRAASARG